MPLPRGASLVVSKTVVNMIRMALLAATMLD